DQQFGAVAAHPHHRTLGAAVRVEGRQDGRIRGVEKSAYGVVHLKGHAREANRAPRWGARAFWCCWAGRGALVGELVERVDERDRVIGVVERADAVRNGWLHRVATTVCRDASGRVLVCRRADGL